MTERKTVVYPNPQVLAEAVAARTLLTIIDLLAEPNRKRVDIAVTGGTDGNRVFAAMNASPLNDAVDWSRVHVWWGDERFVATGEGTGPVGALDAALRMAILESYPQVAAMELTDYKVRLLDESQGTDAITRVTITATDGVDTWGTVGVSENVIEASWNALVDSLEYGLFRARVRA